MREVGVGVWDVLQVLARRWYVVLVATLLALGASYAVKSHPSVYWSRAEVNFLAPSSTAYPNSLTTTSSDLVVTASLIAKRINGNLTWNHLSDPAATIVGEGIYDGWSLHVPDLGGQWGHDFSRQVLDVQVAGPSAQAVRDRQNVLLAEIDSQLADLQSGVRESDRITTAVVPSPPNIIRFHGSNSRSLAMIWLLAGGGSVAGVLELERRRTRAVRRGGSVDGGATGPRPGTTPRG